MRPERAPNNTETAADPHPKSTGMTVPAISPVNSRIAAVLFLLSGVKRQKHYSMLRQAHGWCIIASFCGSGAASASSPSMYAR